MSGCNHWVVSSWYLFMLLLNCNYSVFSSLSCHSSLTVKIHHDGFLFPNIAKSTPLCSFPPPDSFWHSICAMPQGLGRIPHLRWSCIHSLGEVDIWQSLSICHSCALHALKGSCWSIDNWCLCWLVLGKISNVARYGWYVGKLRLVYQSWWCWLTWTKKSQRLGCQYNRNSNANRTMSHSSYPLSHGTSLGCP